MTNRSKTADWIILGTEDVEAVRVTYSTRATRAAIADRLGVSFDRVLPLFS